MKKHNDPEYLPTNPLDNYELESSIIKMLSNPSIKYKNQFIGSLLSSSLIVLISDFIHDGADAFDEEGCFALSQYDKIPLVTFDDEVGDVVFPVFTNVSYAENLPYFEGYIPLIIPAPQVLEMAQTMDCDKLTFNFESSEMVELDEVLIDSIVFRLRSNGELSQQCTYMQKESY